MPKADIILKKTVYPINLALETYLEKHNRISNIPISYEDLLRFSGSIVVYDKDEVDTLWIRLFYQDHERDSIDESLKKIYSLLHADGSTEIYKYLLVDAIDFCTFGNTRPFRIKIRNILNDNSTYIYIKKADASRVYGLELEHLLSPNRINFLVFENTLIEEHIAGIPGDIFLKNHLEHCGSGEKSQIAKEFVKFNERCTIRLLGDMRSYNYVVVPTHDFDQVVYRIRAIDFDQQSYEGNLKLYKPQFFKDNSVLVKLVSEKLDQNAIHQYQLEERALLSKRYLTGERRIQKLIRIMSQDKISNITHVERLKLDLLNYTSHVEFKRCNSMGEILKTALDFVVRNYKHINPRKDLSRFKKTIR
jgi:hypothetical protein